jgi:hypothetical protein
MIILISGEWLKNIAMVAVTIRTAKGSQTP